MMGTWDVRRSTADGRVVRGFYAVHYAAMHGSLRALEALMPTEWQCKTQEPFVGRLGGAAWPAGLDVLGVCIA